MVANNISIESCLTSNVQTGTVAKMSQHPIKTFLQHGVNVCLNTDDPAVEGIEIAHEFKLAEQVLKFNALEIKQLQENAITASFLSDDEKKQLRNKSQFNHAKAQ